MYSSTTQAACSPVIPALYGVIDRLSLNYKELRCLEMALYFLTTQLNQPKQQNDFNGLRHYRLNYINAWLHNIQYRSQLRFDSTNRVDWAVMDIEDIRWLALALELGIFEDIVIALSTDDAHYECDMATVYGDKSDFTEQFRSFYHYYCQIARLRQSLLTKLKHILDNHAR